MQIQQRTKRWTEEENQVIIDNYLNMSDKEIGDLLGRSESGVKGQRQKLNLFRPYKPRNTKTKHPKPTFEEIKRMFEERDYVLLSDESEYVNQSSKMRYICPKHEDKGVQEITVYHLKEGKGCYYCGRERTEKARQSKVTEDEDRELCEKKGFEYIKTEKHGTSYYIYFICNKHRMLGVQKMQRGNMNREEVSGCQYCYNKNLPDWYVKYMIETNYPNLTVLSPYKGMNKPLTCYCKNHNVTFTNVAKEIFHHGRGCSKCAEERMNERAINQRLSLDEVRNRILLKNDNVEILNLEDYCGFETIMKLRCKDCGTIWYQPFHSICVNSCRCPLCQRKYSIGEQCIADYLTKHNILFIPQYRIPECRGKNEYPFDFGIIDDNDNLLFLIEFQGEQHYKPIQYFGGEKKFEGQIIRDEYKKSFCENNNIKLLIIPYWEKDSIDQILDDFISTL